MSESILIISAGERWVDTGVKIGPDLEVTVERVSGSWTANPATGLVGANGNEQYVAKEAYTLPGTAEGALIGMVGTERFLLGDGPTRVPTTSTGNLMLQINDDERDAYGKGFSDNEGSLRVSVSTKQAENCLRDASTSGIALIDEDSLIAETNPARAPG
jgi:glucose dehydrogenase